MELITKRVLVTVMGTSAAGDQPSMLISTLTPDRDGDIVVPSGGIFAPYLRNPVVGFQHFRTDPMPIGATTSLSVEPGGIRASWRWLEGDPLADRVKNAFGQGVIRAASIGFMAHEWEPLASGGRRFTSWELTEWSLVSVPSNPDAVRVLRGLALWPEDDAVLELDDDEVFELPDADAPDDIVLELADDEVLDIAPRELSAAIAEVLRAAMADHVGRAVRRELDRHRGRLVDDDAPWLTDDADVARVRRAEARRETCDVTNAELAAAVREVVPDLLRQVVNESVARGVRLARGRLD